MERKPGALRSSETGLSRDGSTVDGPEDWEDTQAAAPICPYCSQEERCDLEDYYPETQTIIVDTCCETFQEDVLYELTYQGRSKCARAILKHLGIPGRQVIDGCLVDLGLELVAVTRDEAKLFVLTHHRHNKPPVSWKFGAGLVSLNTGGLVAVMMAGRPVARKINHNTTLEINRVCNLDTPLAWNASSMLYGYACREAKKRGYLKAITYTLESEDGTSLRAAGFEPVARTKGGSWDRKARPRQDAATTVPKIRWERALNKCVLSPQFSLSLSRSA